MKLWHGSGIPFLLRLQVVHVYVPWGCALRWALLAMVLQTLVWACQGVVVMAGVGSREDAAVAAVAAAAAARVETASGRPCDHT